MTNTASSAERAAALTALLAGNPGEEAAPAALVPTGVEVYAGGDVKRILIADANLVYRADGFLHRAIAAIGDTVTLDAAQAKRLDSLATTVPADELPKADVDAPVSADGVTLLTDEQIAAGKAEDLVAYVAQNPDERVRVRAIEETRKGGNGKGPRATVIAATEPTPVEDDEAKRIEDERVADAAAKAAEGTS